MRKNIILTGLPHSGKSTLLLNIMANSSYGRSALITQEILENKSRVGFRMLTPIPFDSVNSTNSAIAHVDFSKKYQVSKYGVRVEEVDYWSNKYLAHLEKPEALSNRINYLDEIGQMQLMSKPFRMLVQKLLISSNTCVATMSTVYQSEFIDVIRNRKDVILLNVTPENRGELKLYIGKLISKIEKAKRYILEPDRFNRKGNLIEIVSDHGVNKINAHKKTCSCDFYNQYKKFGLCSHLLACEEYYSL